METQEKLMSENESLQLITQMINSAKQNLKEQGIIFLFWGYLILFACLLDFALGTLGYGDKIGWMWAIVMTLGGIYSGIMGYKKNKKEKVKTHIDRIMSYLWGAFGISFLVIFFALGKYFNVNQGAAILFAPFIMMLYGIGTFVSGGILQFRPLIIGGLCCFVLAIISSLIPGDINMVIEIQLLCICLALIAGYIIPGHLLRKANNN